MEVVGALDGPGVVRAFPATSDGGATAGGVVTAGITFTLEGVVTPVGVVTSLGFVTVVGVVTAETVRRWWAVALHAARVTANPVSRPAAATHRSLGVFGGWFRGVERCTQPSWAWLASTTRGRAPLTL